MFLDWAAFLYVKEKLQMIFDLIISPICMSMPAAAKKMARVIIDAG